jgi:hypothetical protein
MTIFKQTPVSMSLRSFLPALQRLAWVAFLFSLPVTSFPYLPAVLGGEALVRPLAVYPLLVLLALMTLPRLLTRTAPKPLLALLVFALVALAGIFLATLQNIEPIQGVSPAARMLRAFATLGLGGAIYFSVTLWPLDRADLRSSLRWLLSGQALALAWGSLQVVNILHFSPAYFRALSTIQRYVSIRRLFPRRVSGLAYEPNWFADQICLLLLPWTFAAVITGETVFPWRWRWLTVEWLLLGWSAGVLLFTYSRSGLAILLLLTFTSVLAFRPSRKGRQAQAAQSELQGLGRRLLLAGLLILVLGGIIGLAARRNNYFARLWRFWLVDTQTSDYLDYIAFGQRLVYWEAAYSVYEEYPLLGSGLGNFAFHVRDHLPPRSYQSIPELLRILTFRHGGERLVTPKNLYARLLAETGLLGVGTFLAFLAAVAGCAVYLWMASDNAQRFWGLAGLLGMGVFLINAFSTDTFSLPDGWVLLGLITASARVFAELPGGQSGLGNGQLGDGSGSRKSNFP